MHSCLCGHAMNSVEEMVQAVYEMGLAGAVFTEHLPLPKALDQDRTVSMHREDLPIYIEELKSLRGRRGYVDITIGAECDWLTNDPTWAEQACQLARAMGAECILGSVHMLDGWAFDNPDEMDQWEIRDVEDVWADYTEHWIRATTSGLFDVMAHPDLPKKFGHVPRDAREYFEPAAVAAADAGVLCEISTAGLRKPIGELYPSADFIRELKLRGVEFTLASDAHSVQEVGFAFQETADVARGLGIERFAFPQPDGGIKWLQL
ncbi:MAG: histidinol-phosphatase HisJ family protein [Actinomycetes bacterium]|nr:histidinol-phosphatase HisJ family protein [Actinomycetes bacterium]